VSWDGLSVVAVEGLESDLGCAVGSIIVRDARGRKTVLRGVDDAKPILDRTVTDSELQGLLEDDLWCAARSPWAAERGKIALVSAPSFCGQLVRAGGPPVPSDHLLARSSLVVTYRDREAVSDFRLDAAKALLRQAARDVREGSRASAAETLDHARYVCDRHTDFRIQLYAIYRKAISREAWAAMSDDARAETELDDAALEAAWARLPETAPAPTQIFDGASPAMYLARERAVG
jgi:hypothetical protein